MPAQKNTPHVSVICTVLNEGESIRRLMDSLALQTRPPDEVMVVDGGSRDNTVEVIQEYADRLPLRLRVVPGANISRGRNAAIEAASGDVIASTDAGVWLEPDWLASLLAPFQTTSGSETAGSGVRNSELPVSEGRDLLGAQRTPCPQVCSGFFVPDPQTPFEQVMGATVLPSLEEIDPRTFLPSSRSVAFTRQVWATAGGYPEWLDYCEDLVFDFRLQDVAGRFAWAPAALAHFRPRSSLRAFFKQYYRYARGDGKADLWRMRHAVRYATYLVALPAIVVLSVVASPLWLLALPAGILAHSRTSYRRLRAYLPALSPAGRLQALLLVPVIRATGDVAKMLGYPVGWAWRLRNWNNAEIHWRKPRTAA
jgi:glycosyltransferase involved in cell wall biosynthesis